MLQQTQVATVIPYYERFLESFPTVCDLAHAPIEAVIDLWAGLGYYSRARNLHRAAIEVFESFGGVFPSELEALMALPGVGRSTAGAIRSIAFDRKGPVLDGNVRRVLVRLVALRGDPRASKAEKLLWQWAEALTPETRPHDYAQAIMDLGATVCTPTRPACERCPWEDDCRARALNIEQSLPEKRPRKKTPEVRQVALVLRCGNRVWLQRRPYEGLLGGLWEFPTRELGEGVGALDSLEQLVRELGFCFPEDEAPRLLGGVRHIYSHFRLDLSLYELCLTQPSFKVAEGGGGQWTDIAELSSTALHGAHKKALPMLDSQG